MKPPISPQMVAASWASYMAKRLVRFKPGRLAGPVSWQGHGDDITTHTLSQPVTDPSYWQGRWVLCPLTLRAQGVGEVELADAVAAVTRERRIVSTEVTGRDGTVKEYITEGDWAVNIIVGVQPTGSGFIADEYPSSELRELRRILEAKVAVEIHSEFLSIFDIGQIVVKSYSVQQTTEANYQAVSISAVSDDDMEIFSTEY